jgi:hypothetical protein
MRSVRTGEFGPGTTMIVKYSFFFIFLDLAGLIKPPRQKGAPISTARLA